MNLEESLDFYNNQLFNDSNLENDLTLNNIETPILEKTDPPSKKEVLFDLVKKNELVAPETTYKDFYSKYSNNEKINHLYSVLKEKELIGKKESQFYDEYYPELKKKDNLGSARLKIIQENKAEIKTIISQTVKFNSLKIEEAQNKNIRNELINYSIILVVLLFSVFIFIKIIDAIKKLVTNSSFFKIEKSKFTNNEALVISFSLGVIASLFVGNYFPVYNYYVFRSGGSIKVPEKLADYFIENFNFNLAGITFFSIALLFYFLFRNNKTNLIT